MTIVVIDRRRLNVSQNLSEEGGASRLLHARRIAAATDAAVSRSVAGPERVAPNEEVKTSVTSGGLV